MNILILEDSSKAGFGGGQRVTLDVINSLKDKNNIYLFDCTEDSFFIKKVKDLGISNIKLKCCKKVYNSIFLSVILIISNIFLLHKFIVKNKIKDKVIVYATTKKGLILAFFLNKLLNIGYIYHAHMIETNFVKNIVNYLVKDSYKVICVSKIVKNQFVASNADVINNAIRNINSQAKFISSKKDFVIATISSLNHIKGVDYFIESYKFLQNKNIKYRIYGEGPLRKKLELNTNKNIEIKGHNENVIDLLLNDIDILVAPSIIQESFGIIILEAFSCGIPVVTTDIGMQKILIQDSDAGKIVPIKNPREIAMAINSILENKDTYELYSKNGLNYASKFDIQNFNKKINKIFQDYNSIKK
jgi:glycosyltransferase involved in cell wall biosynthesis